MKKGFLYHTRHKRHGSGNHWEHLISSDRLDTGDRNNVGMQDDIFNGEFRSNQNIWDF